MKEQSSRYTYLCIDFSKMWQQIVCYLRATLQYTRTKFAPKLKYDFVVDPEIVISASLRSTKRGYLMRVISFYLI